MPAPATHGAHLARGRWRLRLRAALPARLLLVVRLRLRRRRILTAAGMVRQRLQRLGVERALQNHILLHVRCLILRLGQCLLQLVHLICSRQGVCV